MAALQYFRHLVHATFLVPATQQKFAEAPTPSTNTFSPPDPLALDHPRRSTSRTTGLGTIGAASRTYSPFSPFHFTDS